MSLDDYGVLVDVRGMDITNTNTIPLFAYDL